MAGAAHEVTTAELRDAWRRAHLFGARVSFSQALAAPAIRIALECSARAHRARHAGPVQPRLI